MTHSKRSRPVRRPGNGELGLELLFVLVILMPLVVQFFLPTGGALIGGLGLGVGLPLTSWVLTILFGAAPAAEVGLPEHRVLPEAEHPAAVRQVMLTAQQKMAPDAIMQKALFEQADRERQIADAEQEVRLLTSADQPDAVKVEAKIRSVEKIRGDGRLALIKAVGEAAKGLTDQQRRVLAGMAPPAMAMPATGMPGSSMPAGGGMMDGDMMGMGGGGPAPMGSGTPPMGGAGMGDV